jgi:hypothetical protein
MTYKVKVAVGFRGPLKTLNAKLEPRTTSECSTRPYEQKPLGFWRLNLLQASEIAFLSIQTHPCSAEVKESVELYLCSPSGPSWPVLG